MYQTEDLDSSGRAIGVEVDPALDRRSSSIMLRVAVYVSLQVAVSSSLLQSKCATAIRMQASSSDLRDTIGVNKFFFLKVLPNFRGFFRRLVPLVVEVWLKEVELPRESVVSGGVGFSDW